MSDYTSTFTEGTGDTIDASDFSTEFDAIETHIATKLDSADVGRGCLVYNDANYTITTSTYTHLTFNTEAYDTDSIHDTVTNSQRLTVPSGVSYIKLHGQVAWSAFGGTVDVQCGFSKNDETTTPNSIIGCPVNRVSQVAGDLCTQNISSPMISVSPGDYFTLWVYQNRGGNETVLAGAVAVGWTYAAMEIIK